MYTIKEVADKLDISEHTLRFWAKNDLFPFITRDKNNIRQFSEDDLGWVKIVKCLRAVGVENKAVKRYVDLCLDGDATIPERFGIIQATKIKALQQLEDLQKQIELLEFKENHYKNLIKNKLSDNWNPATNIQKESIA